MDHFFVKTYKGLENVLAKELIDMGASEVRPDFRGVHFQGDKAMMYKVNYKCRTALRVLKKIGDLTIPDEKELYDQVKAIEWTEIFALDQTFCVDVVGVTDTLKNSQFTALKIKDAIVDQFREKYDKRPNVFTEQPNYRIHLHIFKNQGSIYLDSSDSSLHLRGYRKHLGKAPLSEVLAAGMIALSGWDKESTLIDPMCGSGTLLLEAAMAAMDWPAQFFRKDFGFFRWNDYDGALWEEVRQESSSTKLMELKNPIYGYDSDMVMARKAKENVISAHCYGDIRIEQKDFFDLEGHGEKGMLLFNPPYDDRVKVYHAADFYKKISDFLKHKWKGYTAWVLLPDTYEAKSFSLRPSAKYPLMNGPTPCTFTRFDLF